MDCHPVPNGNSLRKGIISVLLSPFKVAIIDAAKITQFRSKQKPGGSQLVFGVQLMLESNSSFVCVSLDIENVFNEVKRSVILEKLWRDPR